MASVVGLSGSPKPVSRSRALLELTLAALERQGAGPSRLIDLAALPTDALLGRRDDRDVTEAIQAVLDSGIVVVSTPIYRATYSGLLKVFFDLLPQDALARKVAIAIATGGGPGHLLAVDHGLRPLLASVGPWWSPRASTEPTRSFVGSARTGAGRAHRTGGGRSGVVGRGGDHMIGVYYEHPHWFGPLFAEFDRRGTPYTRLHAEQHRFDPGSEPPYDLVFNRMSPSAWQRGHGHAVFYTHQFLAHLERRGVRVVNGQRAPFRPRPQKRCSCPSCATSVFLPSGPRHQ